MCQDLERVTAQISGLRAILTTSIILKVWSTCPHVSNMPVTSTTDNVSYAEFPLTRQKRFTADR